MCLGGAVKENSRPVLNGGTSDDEALIKTLQACELPVSRYSLRAEQVIKSDSFYFLSLASKLGYLFAFSFLELCI